MSRIVAWALFALTAVLVPVAVVLAIVGERRGLELVDGSTSRLILVGLGGAAALLSAAVGLLIAHVSLWLRERPSP